MPLTLQVDGPRWRDHLRRVADAHPGIVPVAKGNGYGFGVGSLARRAQWLGCDALAVGTYAEIREVEQRFDGDIVVLEPWRPFHPIPDNPRVIHTVGRRADLDALAASGLRPRVLLEGLTEMRRHGFDAAELQALGSSLPGVRVEGHALHFPLTGDHVPSTKAWLGSVPGRRWYVSHLGDAELRQLAAAHRAIELRPRIGTALWLGDRGALTPRATVVDAHPVSRGDRVGYRQRRIGRDGHLLVVSGGTAHGIALEAPSSATTARQRAVSVARGGLEAAGRSLSPFVVAGKRRWFAEPPHMQVSMLLLPDDVEPPAVGDEVDVQVRFTTTLFDAVQLS